MARGMLGGIVFGGLVSVGAAVGISVLLDPPTRPDAIVDAPARSDAPAAPDQEAAAGFGDADLVTGGAVPTVSAPRPETTAAVTAAGTDTPTVPDAGGADVPAFDNGTSGSETALAALPQNEPVLPAPQAALPDAPGAAEELSISTEPAQPPAPKVDDPLDTFDADNVETPVAPGAPDVGEEPVIARPASEAGQPEQAEAGALEGPVAEATPVGDQPAEPIQPSSGEVAEAAPADVQQSVVTGSTAEQNVSSEEASQVAAEEPDGPDTTASTGFETEEPVPSNDPDTAVATETGVETPETVVSEAPTPEASEETATTDTAEVAGDAAEAESADAQAVAEDEVDVVAQAETTGARVQIGRPARSIIDRTTPAEEVEPVETSAEAPAPRDVPVDGPSLKAYAQDFQNPDNKPLMSIVLIDDADEPASGDASLSALKRFPYPLSFAIDPTLSDAAERMAAYREAGFEVLALIDFPSGATPQDAAVNLDATLALLPQTVALIEGPKTGLQETTDLGEQVLSTVQETGHGLVLQARGLNALQKDAERGGVASRIVFRDVDSAGQDARTIRRFLDQAAFRAGQEGGVVMMGRLRAETMSALLSWAGQDRAARVALSPVSAVLDQE